MKTLQRVLLMVFLLPIFWQANAQTIDVSNSFQMLTRPDGTTKRFGLTTATNTSREVRAYHTYGRRESMTIRFLGDWLDITDEVTFSGTGISLDRIVSKGKTRIGTRDVPFCEVRFNIAANASDGIRTVRLRRPAFMSKDETAYTINLQKNIRISSPSPVFTSRAFGTNQTFSISGEGFSKWLRTDQPRVPTGSILSTLLLFTSSDPNRYDFRAVFRSAGNMTYADLFNNHLIMTTGTVAVHMGANLSMTSNALVSIQPPPPPPPLTINPNSITFGSTCIGVPVTRTVTITNNTSNVIQLTNITLSNNVANAGAFSLVNPFNATNIGAGGTFRFDVRFSPTQMGNASGNIVISHNAGNNLNVTLSGSTTVPLSVAPTSIDFGRVGVRTNNTRQFTISNACPNPVTINTIVLRTQGTPFTFNGAANGTVVPANGRISPNVIYAPTVAGAHSNSITITPSVGNVMNVSLTGTAEQSNPELRVSMIRTFYSDGTITNPDREQFNLCPIETRDDIPINTDIPRAQVRIANYGTAPSPATTISFQRGNNTNYQNASTTITVPVIQPGGSVTLDLPTRLNSLVCTLRRQGSCLRCNSSINPHWNDRGICVVLTPVPGDTNTFDDRFCLQ
jgi:hypothetical protein